MNRDRTVVGLGVAAAALALAAAWGAHAPVLAAPPLSGRAAIALLCGAAAAGAFVFARRRGLDVVEAGLSLLPLVLAPSLVDLSSEPVGLGVAAAAAASLWALAANDSSWVAEGAVAASLFSPFGLVPALVLAGRRLVEGARRRRIAIALVLLLFGLAIALALGGARRWLNLAGLPFVGAGAMRLVMALWPPALHTRIALASGPLVETLLPLGWILLLGGTWVAARQRQVAGGLAALVAATAVAVPVGAALASGAVASGAAVFLVAVVLPPAMVLGFVRVRELQPERILQARGAVLLAAIAMAALGASRWSTVRETRRVLADAAAGAPFDPTLSVRAASLADSSAALAILDECVLRSSSAECEHARGEIHLRARDYVRAVPALSAATERAPQSARAWFSLARAAYEVGSFDTARDAVMRGFVFEDDADARIVYGKILMRDPATRERGEAQLRRASQLLTQLAPGDPQTARIRAELERALVR